jgi:hypothetical protein
MKMDTSIATQIARTLVDRLPKGMADELRIIIARSEKEAGDSSRAIIQILKQNENVVLWFLEQMELQSGRRDGVRGFGPLAGDSSAPISNKWVCSEDAAETLPVIQEGEPAPRCAKHKTEMVREKKRKDKSHAE